MVKECLLLMRDDASKQSQVNILESYSAVSPCSAQFPSNILESKSGYCCASEKVFITRLVLILSTHIYTTQLQPRYLHYKLAKLRDIFR